MTLEKRIDSACEYLPYGWRLRINIERDAAYVTAIRPDGTEVPMPDGERDIEERVTDAILFALDTSLCENSPGLKIEKKTQGRQHEHQEH